MPRRLFKPLSRQRHRWKERWFMRPFRLLLEHPAYWSLNRRSVTRAFALGLFIAFIPMPIHLLLGAALALLLRLNVPAAVAGTFIAIRTRLRCWRKGWADCSMRLPIFSPVEGAGSP